MSSLAAAILTRLGPTSLNQLSVLHNRPNWLSQVPSCNYTARSAEERLGLQKPKRPSSSFLMFVGKMRPALKSKNPTASAPELVHLASKHWQQLDEEVKKKMSKEFADKMDVYRKQKLKFEESLTEDQLKEINQLKDKLAEKKEKKRLRAEFKENGRPKKPPSAYILFSQADKDTVKKIGLIEYMKKTKGKWLALSPQEKVKFEKQASDLMDKYQKDMAVWEEKMLNEGKYELVRKHPFKSQSEKGKANK